MASDDLINKGLLTDKNVALREISSVGVRMCYDGEMNRCSRFDDE